MKKFFIFLALFISITMPVFAATTLYQTTAESKISSGVLLKNYIRFTSSGWQNINVLEIDMDDKYTNLGLLTSENRSGYSTKSKDNGYKCRFNRSYKCRFLSG